MASVRTKITVVATVLFAVPLIVAAALLMLSLRSEAMRPDLSPVRGSSVCVFSGITDTAELVDIPGVGQSPKPRAHIGQACGDGPSLTTVPAKLSGFALRDLAYPDWQIYAHATTTIYSMVPDLSLWPLTEPESIGYFVVAERYRAHSSQTGVHLRDQDPVRYQALAAIQGRLNTQVMLIAGGALALIALVAFGTRLLAGRLARPVPAPGLGGSVGRLDEVAAEAESDLVLLARRDTGTPPSQDSFDFAALVYRQTARRHPPDLGYTVDLGDDPVLVRGQPELLDRVVAETLEAAERRAKTRVTVRLRTTTAFAVLETLVDGSPPGSHHYPSEIMPVRS